MDRNHDFYSGCLLVTNIKFTHDQNDESDGSGSCVFEGFSPLEAQPRMDVAIKDFPLVKRWPDTRRDVFNDSGMLIHREEFFPLKSISSDQYHYYRQHVDARCPSLEEAFSCRNPEEPRNV
ncbi:DUF6012 family protein [Marinospirillum sp.]|uniref:DUF6012 family protein n=1 Tax=Marinospirillum sp. TaxID=2183934 RepID=UPI003458E43F